MKIGDLLINEIKNTPRLKYPLKIIKVETKNAFSELEKFESKKYVNNCKFFIKEVLKETSPKKKLNNFLLPKLQECSFSNNSGDSDKQIFPKLKPKRIKSCTKKHLYKLGSIENSARKKNNNRLQSGKIETLLNVKLNKIFLSNNGPLLTMEDDTDNERKKLQKIFDLRIERKFRSIDKITDKLNKPLFLFRKNNNRKEKNFNKAEKKFYRL